MKRRDFFGFVPAGVLALFGVAAAKAAPRKPGSFYVHKAATEPPMIGIGHLEGETVTVLSPTLRAYEQRVHRRYEEKARKYKLGHDWS